MTFTIHAVTLVAIIVYGLMATLVAVSNWLDVKRAEKRVAYYEAKWIAAVRRRGER